MREIRTKVVKSIKLSTHGPLSTRYGKLAFTLVELIVVMLILGIIATIAFLNFADYPKQARDIVRISNIEEIEDAIEFYKIDNGDYPIPTNAKTETFSGKTWKVGVFGKDITDKIKSVVSLPKDPKTKSGYYYAISEDLQSYRIIGNLEKTGEKYISTNYKQKTYPKGAFVIKIDTTKDKKVLKTSLEKHNLHSSNSNQYELPLIDGGDYNFVVDWGDGKSSEITSYDDPDKLHTYSSAGKYTLVMNGKIKGYGNTMEPSVDSLKLQEILQWGNLEFYENYSPLSFSENLLVSAIDQPILTPKSLNFLFMVSKNFQGDLSHWDVSITSKGMDDLGLHGTFYVSDGFKGNLSGWKLPYLESIYFPYVFAGTDFQGNLSNWDLPNVHTIYQFGLLASFKGNLSNWKTPNLKYINYLFEGTVNFQGNLSGWDTSKVESMSYLAKNAKNFNIDLSSWDTSSVKYHEDFDLGATSWEEKNKPKFSK